MLRRDMLEGIHVDAVLKRRHLRRHHGSPDLHEVGTLRQHRLLVHPHDMRGELIGNRGPRIVRRAAACVR